MKKPEPPIKPKFYEIDNKYKRQEAERKYWDEYSDYEDRQKEYERQRYGDINLGPWGDGE